MQHFGFFLGTTQPFQLKGRWLKCGIWCGCYQFGDSWLFVIVCVCSQDSHRILLCDKETRLVRRGHSIGILAVRAKEWFLYSCHMNKCILSHRCDTYIWAISTGFQRSFRWQNIWSQLAFCFRIFGATFLHCDWIPLKMPLQLLRTKDKIQKVSLIIKNGSELALKTWLKWKYLKSHVTAWWGALWLRTN